MKIIIKGQYIPPLDFTYYMKYFIGFFLFINSFRNHAQCVNGNCVTGTGTYIYPSGAKYTGQFVDNKINGKGYLYLTNGDTYQGDWINNYREGTGKMVFQNGDIYNGEWKKSKFDGRGQLVFANGGKYVGDWKNNLPHGKGEYIYSNGEKYTGLLAYGQRHGAGIYHYTDGSIYDGQWKENNKDGLGVFIDSNKKSTRGRWKDDILIDTNEVFVTTNTNTFSDVNSSSNRLTNSSTNISIDCNTNKCHDVIGFYVFKDGSKYVGPFKNGNPYGQGILYYANGDRYEGEWDDIAPHGNGVMHFTNGRVFAAVWERGRPIKQLDNRLELPKRNDIKVYRDNEVRIWPVIIGVAQYSHMPVLKYADDDAYRVYAFLKSPEGGAIPDNQIKVLIDEDATREKIIRSLQEQFGQADENDMVMLYYSGHGIKGSLLPIDYDGFNNKLYHDDIIELMETSKAKHKLCMIDACYAGSMLEAKADLSAAINVYYGALDKERGGTAMILSCKEREVSLEDSGLRQGIFSHYLMKGLKGQADANNNNLVTVQELFNYIKNQVGLYTNSVQNPIIEGNYNPAMPVAWIRK